METPTIHFTSLLCLITISLQILDQTTISTAQNHCTNDNLKISSPFELVSDNSFSCGSQFLGYNYHLFCSQNLTTLCLNDHNYYVKSINYNNFTIRLVSSEIHNNNNDCSSIPSSSLSASDIPRFTACRGASETVNRNSLENPEALEFSSCENGNCSAVSLYDSSVYWGGYEENSFKTERIPRLETEIRFKNGSKSVRIAETLIFLRCEKAMLDDRVYIDAFECLNGSKIGGIGKFSYVVYGEGFKFADLGESCEIYRTVLVSSPRNGEARKSSYREIYDELVRGFELSWVQSFDENCDASCYVDENRANGVYCRSKTKSIANIIFQELVDGLKDYYFVGALDGHLNMEFYMTMVIRVCGFILLAYLIIKKFRERHLSEDPGIEAFLQSSDTSGVIRYKYSEVKKMADGFNTKLGQGGFGSVYKGTLRSGRFAAIKMLSSAKGSGEDFISEVGTIGRIHHVNVVRLIGFCVEGSKRALIYDFMPNGSLDKYIFSEKEGSSSLSWDDIFKISLGVARGIEYLHRGCDMQILHFDIKPHNILLDENFVPKVSDFGLARLCPLDDTGVSLTAARGTIGYIAPELFYKNIGGVSHKSDVYSFGMLLMEMASRRRNVNLIDATEGSSEAYFPLWIYDQFEKRKSIEMENFEFGETKTRKKMIIVALWCIQLKPNDRPSMKEVIEMLEGDVELLQMPPKPYLFPQNDVVRDETSSASTCLSEEESAEISLLSNESISY